VCKGLGGVKVEEARRGEEGDSLRVDYCRVKQGSCKKERKKKKKESNHCCTEEQEVVNQ
jgi:hypothetical protein